MDMNSLSNCEPLCEDLFLCHEKIESMLALLLHCNVQDYTAAELHAYYSAIDDFVLQAKEYTENLLSNIEKICTEEEAKIKDRNMPV